MSKIVAIGGSLRPQSVTYRILGTITNKLNAMQGVEVELIDLKQLTLPFCTGESSYPQYPDVNLLRQKVKLASGILLATPEYHGSLSGVLKNTLDLLDEDQLNGKMAGLISVVGGVHSANAVNTLRTICRQMHCWVLPDQIIIARANLVFDQKGELTDPLLDQRLDLFATRFMQAVQKFHP